MTDHIQTSLDTQILTLTINRPERKNALTQAMYGALADAIVGANDDKAVRAIIITGEGDMFTAGNDLGDFASDMERSSGEPPVTRFLNAIRDAEKPLIAAVNGPAIGVGLTMLLHRRLFDPRIRLTSSFGDIAILVLLYLQLILGMLTIIVSLGHLDGHEMVKFMSWAQGILTLQPSAAAYVADVAPVFKLHLLLGMTIFLVFPFTRLVHVWSAPVWYLGRQGYQVVRTTRSTVHPAE